jgi:SulP family sulfate permease
LLLLLGACAKFGAVADFLSKPVLVGYMTGAALILAASQLDKFFGIPLKHGDFFPRLAELAAKLGQIHVPTFLLGLGLLGLLIARGRLAPKIPGALAVCVAAIAISWALGLEGKGVAVIGSFPGGLPALTLPRAPWHDVQALLPAAVGVALLTYTEGILLARAFAAKHDYEVSANQELTALGLADVAAGLFQGFSITGSQARTAVNEASGGKTQLSSLVAAATLALFLLFLTPLIARLPQVALAVILLYAGFGLIEVRVLIRIYRRFPRSSVLAGLTTLCVLAAGVVQGILFGVALSLLGLIHRLSDPADGVLSEVPGRGFHDLGGGAETQTVPGLIAYRFYAPLLFANAGHFAERVRALVAANSATLRCFLLDAQAISYIDLTAAETLQTLAHELRRQGIALKIAHANRPLREVLERSSLVRQLGPESFFGSVHECIEEFQRAKLGVKA